ncbi:hypothetical protein QNO07_12490 [Streptomyces sp. 549]|uniref:hypothetical protein n=1 Tax=Streptomyces sp. 549 TaxID=3049076 RepID=UPI0024C396F6|nr:hypothetical protein [Streptomyces sp. 549]MDK1474226.1 hypothetical protein [Streptomyces sp. 549]
MRSVSVFTGAALSIAVLAVPASSAFAQEDVSGASVSLSPPAVTAGGVVEVRVDCTAYNAPSPTVVQSDGFRDGPLTLKPTGQEGRFWGQATTVAKPGSYAVKGACTSVPGGSSAFSATLTVNAAPAPHSPSPSPSASHSAAPAPSGPVRTGTGSTADPAGGGQLLAGAATLLVAAAGGVWFLRRRGEQRP